MRPRPLLKPSVDERWWALPTGVRLTIVLFLMGAVAWFGLPTRLFHTPHSPVFTDRQGRVIAVGIAADGVWRFPPMEALPDKYRITLLRFEDHRFYRHPGIDPLALMRALQTNLSDGNVVSGASTITMQVARLGLGYHERSLLAKLHEAAVALKLETVYGKEYILRLYASHAPFGGNVVGLEAAAWRYFGRPAAELSWAESATLAVLPNAPSLIRLDRNRPALLAKRNRLLERLLSAKEIDADTCRLAKEEPLPPEPMPMPRMAPHLMASMVAGAFQESRKPRQDGIFETSIEPELQMRVEALCGSHMEGLRANNIRNAAVLVLDNADGRIKAYVGNNPGLLDGGNGAWVDIVLRPRSTGSLLKPFLYAAMLSEGSLLSEQLVADVPTRYPGFSPENHTKTFRGAVPAYLALARSLNIPAVRLLREYGVDRFAALLKRLGMTTLTRNADDYGLPLILGGAEGTLWELAGLYSSLARTAQGKAVSWYPPTPWRYPAARVGHVGLSTGAAWLTLDALERVNRPGAEESWESYGSSRRIAWKTGTSQGFRDAWAIGITRDYTVAVWIGNADGEARPELGGTAAAAPLMFSIFEQLPQSSWIDKPESALRSISVCRYSGLPPGPDCAATKMVNLPVEANLPNPCGYCQTITLSADQRQRVRPDQVGGAQLKRVSWFVLPPVLEWYYVRSSANYHPLPPWRPGIEPDRPEDNLGLVYPEPRSRIYVPRDFDGIRGSFVAEAVHRLPGLKIFWHLDKQYVGTTRHDHNLRLQAGAGEHTLTLVDERGESETCHFMVLSPSSRE